MKTILILIAILFSAASFAGLTYNEGDLRTTVLEHFNLTGEFIKDEGGCTIVGKKHVKCEFYYENGRTPDTFYATFKLVNGKLQLVEAYGEHGC